VKVNLTPAHKVDLSPEFEELVVHAPIQDVVIRTIARKSANFQPLVQSELVIAGEQTRMDFPQAQIYPVHFRKTYYPTALHPHPEKEFTRHERASQILNVPPPIGATWNEFRSCFIPGQMFSKISPFGVEPPMANLRIARDTSPAALIGMWYLLEDLYKQVTALHLSGMCHGDLFLHNVVIPHSPIGLYLIDFEQAIILEELNDPSKWEALCQQDLNELLKHAIWVQCGLGYQEGPLADCCLEHLEALMGHDADSFRRAMDHA